MSAGGFWRRLASLTRKEVRQLVRDRSNLLIGIGLPIALILIFGYGLSLDVKRAIVAIVLDDPSPVARDVAAGISRTEYLEPHLVRSYAEGEKLMRAREVDAVVQFPSDFTRNLNDGHAQIQVLVQGSDATRAASVSTYVSSALAGYAEKQADRGSGPASQAGAVTIVQRMWFNAANTSTWYLVPGLIVLIMTLVGAFLTALVMAREWERGTLEALFVTPVRPVEILLAKIIPCFAIGMIGLALCLLAARFLFDVPIYGSFIVLVIASMLYMLVALGIGLLISAVTKNQFLASQIALLASFLPAMMLSGFIFDLRNVPTAIRVIGNLLPATYFMELVKSLFLAGDFWPMILKNCAILAAYAVALLGLARLVTRKRLD
ncbi:ABC transporter permease [Pseudomonas nicosulfuronedens]|uniref:ABC transporter permease n=1 Tax=Pseudomonas nicosulfuronedens TaxID=2571105 RepID=A0A5R9R3S8_9PSED|nr:ABC transporter permease [Pseudomonas nicosulfuronedens]MDH1010705.1 ABC transporter permease [Pseudomonas nicosulfuronedens]MDH1979003.1 ABC transporter permease [Pseudomonas nicosulfuronedens]MDH2025904.1 ABC transporter permease [Pseudomonas nicosulfuronedens]TLX77349.1 ABC transporter permease [Pseudomonas nicosulfuronedens]